MPIRELTRDSLVQRCANCDIESCIPLTELEAGTAYPGGVDPLVIRLTPCPKCQSVEFLLRSPNDEPDHPAPGSFGHRYRLLVDHLHAKLVERGQVPPGTVADAPKRRVDDDALRQWFPNGLILKDESMTRTLNLTFMRHCALALLVIVGVRCHPATCANAPERQTARATILTVDRAVSVADELCATVARERGDAQIARTCDADYKAARPALIAAESAVDAWDSGQRGNVACTLGEATRSLGNVADALGRAGVSVPPLIVDALALSGAFGEVCHGGT